MVVYGLLFLLLTSFTFHITIIVLYIKVRDNKYFFWFLATVVLNMAIALVLIVVSLTNPHMIRALKLKTFFWLLSGFVSMLMLAVKIFIFRNIYKRSRKPEWRHFNYFGKKVYEKGLISQAEYFGIFISLPFFLITGAYFVSRLLNYFMHRSI